MSSVIILSRSETIFATLSPRRAAKMLALLQPIFRVVPTMLKVIILSLFLVNIRSWPLAWHLRVWRPVYAMRWRFLLLRLSLLFKSKQVKKAEKEKWFESLSPVGTSPFDRVVSYRTWAGPDDCDFNIHLSNSCYAKNLDSGRFKAALAFYPTFFRCGGWIALGATHYKFLKEIPMFAMYEMRISVGSWDRKWLYVIIRYVTKSKGKGKPSSPTQTPSEQPTPPIVDSFPIVHLHTPATGTSTPSGLPQPAKQLAAAQLLREEPDGATVHCVAVSELCFKIGRITVPPGLLMACEGFSAPPLSSSSEKDSEIKPYSHANPPPHWESVRALRPNGNLKGLQTFLKGGWKEVPENERWWEEALGGVVEEKRKINLELVEGVSKGMEGAGCC